jgi:O-antigen/teichoic acid export membrane protein
LSPWLVRWLTAPAFHDAWPLVGILAWQALFYGLFLIASAGIWKAEKTYLNLYLMSGAAVVGLLLNWALVPAFGGVGAAVATVITYFTWIVASMVISERLWLVSFPVKLMLVQITVAASLIAWFILTDLSSDFYLKVIVGSVICAFIATTAIPSDFYSKIRKRIIPA